MAIENSVLFDSAPSSGASDMEICARRHPTETILEAEEQRNIIFEQLGFRRNVRSSSK